MKLASYKGTREFPKGIANILIRLRLKGIYSHTELIIEPSDGVDYLLPDGDSYPTSEGFWSVSSVAAEKLPEYSKLRAGKTGGVRFKRINFDPSKWDIIDIPQYIPADTVIRQARKLEGSKYDWLLIGSFLAWFLGEGNKRFTCNEFVAQILGIPEPWRTDPCSLHNYIKYLAGVLR